MKMKQEEQLNSSDEGGNADDDGDDDALRLLCEGSFGDDDGMISLHFLFSFSLSEKCWYRLVLPDCHVCGVCDVHCDAHDGCCADATILVPWLLAQLPLHVRSILLFCLNASFFHYSLCYPPKKLICCLLPSLSEMAH